MCGIAGIWSDGQRLDLAAVVHRMNGVQVHRGPDGQGVWLSKAGHVCLGHTRLSILDLSELGKQPMAYGERYTITYSGEIYNYLELREELLGKGYVFRTRTDTEVLLAAYHAYGHAMLEKLDGMFAFVLFDEEKNELFGARDRFGEKPLFYSNRNDDFLFASEIKALKAGGLNGVVSEKMMYNYLANDLVENPCDQSETFYANIRKLKPAHYFVYSNHAFKEHCYWQMEVGASEEFSSAELGMRMRELLHQSVLRRLRADVRIGASLSGGLDSSAVVAMMADLHAEARTYSARFHNFHHDEGYYVNIISKKYNLHHVDVYVDENNLLRDLSKLMYHQEEPFQTGSIYAQFCVYEAARADGIVVMLDGQGADEYQCGYVKDFKWYLRELLFDRPSYHQFINEVRLSHDLALSLSFRDVLTQVLPRLAKTAAEWKRSLLPFRTPGISQEFNRTYGRMASPFSEFSSLKEALCHQMTHQGLEKLLRFADRNAMAHSLEVRLPYLSHELVAFVMSLHSRFLLAGGWSKSIMRTGMKGVLPDEIVWRRHKIGFEVPEDQWMNNPAAIELAYSSKRALMARGFINDQYAQTWKCINAGMFLGDI